VHPNSTFKHCNENLVHDFNLAVGLRVIWGEAIVAQTQCRCHLSHHVISEMGAMVCENGLRYAESRNNMVENKLIYCLTIYKACWHRFSPFGEITHNDNDITMPPG